MCPIGSVECESKLDPPPGEGSATESANSDGVVLCPECSARLHITARNAVESTDRCIRSNEAPDASATSSTVPRVPTGKSAAPVGEAPTRVTENSSERPSRSGPPGFFGALSSMMVDWDDFDGSAESSIRSKLEPANESSKGAVDPECRAKDDIDSLLESIIQLVSRDSPKTTTAVTEQPHATTQVPRDSQSSVDTTRTTANIDVGILNIDTANLDLSVVPFTVFNEPSDEKGANAIEISLGTPRPIADCSPRTPKFEIPTIGPLARNVTTRLRARSLSGVLWFGLGVAMCSGFVLLMQHKGNVADVVAGNSPTDMAPHAAALLAAAVQSLPTSPATSPKPLQVVLVPEQLPLVSAPTEPAGAKARQSAQGATASTAQLEAQPQPALELNTDPDPESNDVPFDANAASSVLEVAAQQASTCRQVGDPSGMAMVSVTFAPSGRVTTATISAPPFMGTATGSCVATTMRDARIQPFAGMFRTLTKMVTIR